MFSDDDYAAYVLAKELGKPENVTNFLLQRSMTAPFTLYNDATGFMEARNADGSWAGPDNGWTEGLLSFVPGTLDRKLIAFVLMDTEQATSGRIPST